MLNTIDLVPYPDVDVDTFAEHALAVSPKVDTLARSVTASVGLAGCTRG